MQECTVAANAVALMKVLVGMETENGRLVHLQSYGSRKVAKRGNRLHRAGVLVKVPDSLSAWVQRYIDAVVLGTRSESRTEKSALRLFRFVGYFEGSQGHDRASSCEPGHVAEWQASLRDHGISQASLNAHLALIAAFATWVEVQAPGLFPSGNPAKGISGLRLPPLEPRALSDAQVRSLKNACEKLERFHRLKEQAWTWLPDARGTLHANARPWRDRAIVYLLLSTGLRREELVRLDLEQIETTDPSKLRGASRARVLGRDMGDRGGHIFLSSDARVALGDYLEKERTRDAKDGSEALLLSAAGVPSRLGDGRLSPSSVDDILRKIGRWHDSGRDNSGRLLSPLSSGTLARTYAFRVASISGAGEHEYPSPEPCAKLAAGCFERF